jgi:hypothetical protein
MWMKNYPAAQNYFSQNIVDEQERHDDHNSTENYKTQSIIQSNEIGENNSKTQGELFSAQENNDKNTITPKKSVRNKKPREKRKLLKRRLKTHQSL